MEITYLKKEIPFNFPSVVKVIDLTSLHCCDGDIDWSTEDDESHESIVGWWKKQLEYKETTKEEFDKVYIKEVEKLNQISKL